MRKRLFNFFKEHDKTKYRIQIVDYLDSRPTEYYPQRKCPGLFSTWEYLYEYKKVPVFYEDWMENLVSKSDEKIIQFFTTYEEALRYLTERRSVDCKGVKKIDVKEIEFSDVD